MLAHYPAPNRPTEAIKAIAHKDGRVGEEGRKKIDSTPGETREQTGKIGEGDGGPKYYENHVCIFQNTT